MFVQKTLISDNPDFTSLLTVDGKLFSLTHFESPRPGAAYLSELEQDDQGKLTVKRTKAVDFSAHGGLWVPCAGSVTPWMTHLGSEEYEPDARGFYESTALGKGSIRDFMRYWGLYEAGANFTKEKAMAGGFYPYRYGYPWETVVKSDFTETTKKLYSHGRQAYELSYVMPDSRTVYGTDDGTNVFFTYFKASTAQGIHVYIMNTSTSLHVLSIPDIFSSLLFAVSFCRLECRHQLLRQVHPDVGRHL
jgi:hypothetical protein